MNLLSTVDITILIVGNDMRIRRFTPTAERMLNLIPGDVGRPIATWTTELMEPC
jgi:two-component system CheB/CheR fusion protein